MKTARTITALLAALALSVSFGAPLALASGPLMVTTAASSITTSSAVLNGSFDPQGYSSTTVRFEYGTTSSLGNATQYMTMYNASSYSDTISGLANNTTYFYRAMGVNGGGSSFGNILSFTTGGNSLSSVITSPATSVSSTSATLNGSFTANNSTSTYAWFEYANNASFIGSSTTSQVYQGSTSGYISQTVYNLTPNTTYYFRAMTQNGGGISYGTPTLTFTTSSNGTTAGTCSISSFYPTNYSVTSGSSTGLYWTTNGCSTASISNIGSVSPVGSGSVVTGSIYGTTTYTLTASSGSNYVTSSVTITVGNNNGGNGYTNCSITSFYPSVYSVNYGSSTTLYWNTSGCTNTSISNIGAVYPTSYGSISTGAIYGSQTYTLTASDSYGSVSRQVSVTSNGYNGNNNGNYGTCTITGFAANNPSLSYGNSTQLYYTTSGCTSVSISGGPVGSYSGTNGTVTTGTLYGNTTYTLTAYGNNTVTSSVTINVGNFITNMWNNVFGSTTNQTYTDNTNYPTNYGDQGTTYNQSQTVTGQPIIQYVDGGTTTVSQNGVVPVSTLGGVVWGNQFPSGAVAVNNPSTVLGATVINAGFAGMPLYAWLILIALIVAIVLLARLLAGRRY